MYFATINRYFLPLLFRWPIRGQRWCQVCSGPYQRRNTKYFFYRTSPDDLFGEAHSLLGHLCVRLWRGCSDLGHMKLVFTSMNIITAD